MTRRPRTAIAIGCMALILCAGVGADAGGLTFGILLYTVDVSQTFARLPVAASEAFDAVDSAMIDLGVPPEDRSEVRQGFEAELDVVEEVLRGVPTLLPFPLLGGSFEVGLPLVVLDGVRFSAGFLSDGVVRGAADLFGVAVPSPLIAVAIDEGGVEGSFELDLSFASWAIATEVAKRFDLTVAALDVAAGVVLVSGSATPQIDIDVPTDLMDDAQAALAALRLDGLSWRAFAVTSAIGIELGLPFLRVVAEVRFVLPISATAGWWNVGVGGIGGSVGMVIRF